MGFWCWLLGHDIIDSEGTSVPTPKGYLESYYATIKTAEGGFTCKRCDKELVWSIHTWVDK